MCAQAATPGVQAATLCTQARGEQQRVSVIMWLTDSVPSCLDKTRPWYAAAAAAGDADAQYNLAKDLLRPDEGGGTPPDAPRARELLQLAAAQGHFVAQNDLGALLLEGAAGVARDAAEAERWIGASAAQGFYRALDNMALVCEQRGDEAAALRWRT